MRRGFLIHSFMAGSLMLAGSAIIGCSVQPTGPAVEAGYVENDPYYMDGGYVGDYWVWHDRDGHERREARAYHEQRARTFNERGGSERGYEGGRSARTDVETRRSESSGHMEGRSGGSAGHAEPRSGGSVSHAEGGYEHGDHEAGGRGGEEGGHR